MTASNTFSIRRRVFTVAIALLLGVTVMLVVFLHDYAQRASDRAFDRLLAASALSIAGSVQIEDNKVTTELPFAALAMLSSGERVFYTVRNAQGSLITGYDDLDPSLPLASSAQAVFNNATYHNDAIRISTMGHLVSANQQAGWITIRVAETRGAREALATEIFNRSALPLILIVAMALGMLWFGIQHAFAPLGLLERELHRRTPDNLEPLASPVPSEVRRLVDALNAFMQRLQSMMNTLNSLVADAAHQIRTPLASLRAQAEVALEEDDPQRLHERLTRIHLNASHASQLVNQFLMDATITHRLGIHSNATVGVAEIINETRRRIGPLDQSRLQIMIAPDTRRARIQGDRIALREMLRNLVDNALRYAPDGDVEINIELLPRQRLALTISDRGPGIPEQDKKNALERFWRGSSAQSQSGSGLGLTIVKSVVQAHNGSLSLRDRAGGGLSVYITLPLAPTPPLTASLAVLCMIGLLTALGLNSLQPVHAQTRQASPEIVTQFPAPQNTEKTLTLAGPTDTPAFTALALGFQRAHPDITLIYREMGSRELYEQAVAKKLGEVDILINSAVDLQVKLANDGYAMHYASPYAAQLPRWAVWRSEVFGFTFEPAVIVYNPERFTAETVPRSRQALLHLLEQKSANLYDRVGTYDIAASSVGYLLAAQDELVSSNFWGLANAMGEVSTQLYSTSAGILDDIEQGHLDLGYNVLGSYAFARQASGHRIGIVIPQDYVLVLARSALIARHTTHPDEARSFIDWILSPTGQAVTASQAGLGSITGDLPSPWSQSTLLNLPQGIIQPIALTPALLVGLDQQRHARFTRNWMRLITDVGAQRMTGR
ncbi:extracellular solute-binding protein [Alcaligenaceae bacterium CGII-47]|nr:extracellular solute-binding protein [Alcaligenaceae bacterium CGII-47]